MTEICRDLFCLGYFFIFFFCTTFSLGFFPHTSTSFLCSFHFSKFILPANFGLSRKLSNKDRSFFSSCSKNVFICFLYLLLLVIVLNFAGPVFSYKFSCRCYQRLRRKVSKKCNFQRWFRGRTQFVTIYSSLHFTVYAIMIWIFFQNHYLMECKM